MKNNKTKFKSSSILMTTMNNLSKLSTRKDNNSLNNLKKYDSSLKNNKILTLNKTEFILNSKNTESIYPFYKQQPSVLESNWVKSSAHYDLFQFVQNNIGSNNKFLLSQYLKSFFKFDASLAKDKNVFYLFNNKKNRFIPSDMNISSFLESYFLNLSSLISRPIINITHNKVIIQLFYLLNNKKDTLFYNSSKDSINKYNSFINKFGLLNKEDVLNGYSSSDNLRLLPIINPNKINIISDFLSRRLKKEVVLDLVRLYYPHFESKILSNALAKIGHKKNFPFIFIMDRILKSGFIKNPDKGLIKQKLSHLPSFLTGINIKLAGRLLSQKVIPRYTVKTAQQGTLSRSPSRLILQGMSTKKNKRGTFSISITMGHGFF